MPRNRRTRRNRRRNRNRKNNSKFSSALSRPIKLSMIGSTAQRQIDAVFNIYAVNSAIGITYYSWTTGLSSPTVSQSVTASCISQYQEFANMAKLYSLFQVKGFQMLVTRNSTILTNSSLASNLPSVFLQVTPNFLPNTTTAQSNVAIADNASEYNICSFSSRNYNFSLPPVIVSRSVSANDLFPFGSQVWMPTIFNSLSYIPDVYLNIGSLAAPTFVSGTPTGGYSVLQVHIKMDVVFASPTQQ